MELGKNYPIIKPKLKDVESIFTLTPTIPTTLNDPLKIVLGCSNGWGGTQRVYNLDLVILATPYDSINVSSVKTMDSLTNNQGDLIVSPNYWDYSNGRLHIVMPYRFNKEKDWLPNGDWFTIEYEILYTPLSLTFVLMEICEGVREWASCSASIPVII